jgi:hypothetical protein
LSATSFNIWRNKFKHVAPASRDSPRIDNRQASSIIPNHTACPHEKTTSLYSISRRQGFVQLSDGAVRTCRFALDFSILHRANTYKIESCVDTKNLKTDFENKNRKIFGLRKSGVQEDQANPRGGEELCLT